MHTSAYAATMISCTSQCTPEVHGSCPDNLGTYVVLCSGNNLWLEEQPAKQHVSVGEILFETVIGLHCEPFTGMSLSLRAGRCVAVTLLRRACLGVLVVLDRFSDCNMGVMSAVVVSSTYNQPVC